MIIDEIEELRNRDILNAFLHTIRTMYHRKEAYRLRSVILTGVSNITGIIQDTASPFNIADQIAEGIYHYNLEAFLASYAQVFGGHVFPEVPEGGGRVDLLILQGAKKWIIEVKLFGTIRDFDKGKRQLFEYMKRSGLNEGYYVVFSDIHKEQQKSSERAECGVMTTWILPVSAPVPSGM